MSKTEFRSEQEDFWAGDFGSDYISRNSSAALLASNINFFCKSLRRASQIGECLEFGANIGMNLKALRQLFPEAVLRGIEINRAAADRLAEEIGEESTFCGSILDYEVDEPSQLVLIKGVLIHTNPEMLPQVYAKLHEASQKYLLVCEYYNPSPMAIPYRGHSDKLFKRDFAGEIMDAHPDLRLVDYGFSYHRDPDFPQDDISWFLMEKRG